MLARAISVLFALALLSGCGQQSPQDTIKAELPSIQSNAATAHLVAESWASGKVPDAYANNALQSAQSEVKTSVQKLSSLPAGSDAEVHRSLIQHLQRVQAAIEQISTSVQKGERTVVPAQVKQLGDEQDALDKIAGQLGVGQ